MPTQHFVCQQDALRKVELKRRKQPRLKTAEIKGCLRADYFGQTFKYALVNVQYCGQLAQASRFGANNKQVPQATRLRIKLYDKNKTSYIEAGAATAHTAGLRDGYVSPRPWQTSTAQLSSRGGSR